MDKKQLIVAWFIRFLFLPIFICLLSSSFVATVEAMSYKEFKDMGDEDLVYKSELRNGKKGYIDLDYIFENYEKTKDAYNDLDKKLSEAEEQHKILVSKIGKVEGQEKDEAINELGNHDTKVRNWYQAIRTSYIKEISEEIDSEILSFGDTYGYSVIKSAKGDKGRELASKVVELLNAKYQK